jgi:hypothetical protein
MTIKPFHLSVRLRIETVRQSTTLSLSCGKIHLEVDVLWIHWTLQETRWNAC